VHCADDSGNGAIIPVWVAEVIDCLSVTSDLTFGACVEARVDDIREAYTADNPEGTPGSSKHCEYILNTDFDVDPKWDPDQITEEDLARTAMQSASPPAWMIAAGIVVVAAGGVFVIGSGWAGLLCSQDVHYACDQVGQGDR
jgi:hypothetical protein